MVPTVVPKCFVTRRTMEDLLLVLLGALLATLSPAVVDTIGRRRRRRDFVAVLTTELAELRFVIATVLLLVQSKRHAMDQATVDLIKPIYLDYRGHADDQPLLDTNRKLLAQGDAAFIVLHNLPTKPPTGLWPLAYQAPFLQAHLSDLTLLPVEQQRALLQVLRELQLFSDQVGLVQKATDRTFDSSLSPASYAANESNLEKGTANLATRCAQLVRATNRFLVG